MHVEMTHYLIELYIFDTISMVQRKANSCIGPHRKRKRQAVCIDILDTDGQCDSV